MTVPIRFRADRCANPLCRNPLLPSETRLCWPCEELAAAAVCARCGGSGRYISEHPPGYLGIGHRFEGPCPACKGKPTTRFAEDELALARAVRVLHETRA